MQAEDPIPRALRDPLPEERPQRANRVRDALISAVQRRLKDTDAAVAELLQVRLAELKQSRRTAAERIPATNAVPPANPERAQRGLLGLAAYIEACEPAGYCATSAQEATIKGSLHGSPSTVLEEFRKLWDHTRTDSQMRAALAPIPDDAGPLHSSALLHRAMRLMDDASPGYLQHFIAYADALSWMERLQQAGLLEARSGNVVASPSGKPRARKRARPKQSAVKSPSGGTPSRG